MFWRNWSWPVRISSVIVVGLVAAILYPVFAPRRQFPRGHVSCISNLKQIGLGLIQYSQDYDERFPPVAAHGAAFGWADAIYPYIKSNQVFQCPVEPNGGQHDPRLSGYTDYWFNAQLSEGALRNISEPARLLAAGDGNDGTDLTNARYSLSALPPQWISDTNSPLYRHLGTANYLFADGHVKAMKPTSISNSWSQTLPFFEPKKVAR